MKASALYTETFEVDHYLQYALSKSIKPVKAKCILCPKGAVYELPDKSDMPTVNWIKAFIQDVNKLPGMYKELITDLLLHMNHFNKQCRF